MQPEFVPVSSLLEGKRLLLIEDNAMVASALSSMLKALGCTVTATVAEIKRALEAAMTDDFDLALVDVTIIGGTSECVARALQKRGKRFVFMSGYSLPTSISPDLQQLPRLTKPFDLNELRDSLHAAIEG